MCFLKRQNHFRAILSFHKSDCDYSKLDFRMVIKLFQSKFSTLNSLIRFSVNLFGQLVSLPTRGFYSFCVLNSISSSIVLQEIVFDNCAHQMTFLVFLISWASHTLACFPSPLRQFYTQNPCPHETKQVLRQRVEDEYRRWKCKYVL